MVVISSSSAMVSPHCPTITSGAPLEVLTEVLDIDAYCHLTWLFTSLHTNMSTTKPLLEVSTQSRLRYLLDRLVLLCGVNLHLSPKVGVETRGEHRQRGPLGRRGP